MKRALAIAFALGMGAPGLQGQPAPDEWRRKPQALQSAAADKTAAGIRAARDSFFDRVIGTPPGGGGSAWDRGPVPEEIPTDDFLTVALVRFADFTTIQSATQQSVYTEVTMDVEDVLRDPSDTARPGKPLTVILGGGTLRLPSGEIIQTNLNYGDFGIEPGHRYLAFLGYEQEGRYFSWMKSWDLTSAVATPTYPADIKKAKDGTSRFAGMPAGTFVALVKSILAGGAK